MEATQGLEVIQPELGEVKLGDGRAITVRPVTMGQLPRFIKAVEPMLGAVASKAQDATELELFGAFAQHADRVNDALAITTGLTLEDVEALPLDDGMALALEVIRVNRDLFTRRLLPMLAQALPKVRTPADLPA